MINADLPPGFGMALAQPFSFIPFYPKVNLPVVRLFITNE